MSASHAVVGVAVVNAVLIGSGYGILAPLLRGAPVLRWLSYGGIALLIGTGVVGLLLANAAIFGLHTTPVALVGTALLVSTAGIATSLLLPRRFRAALHLPPGPVSQSTSAPQAVIVIVARFGVFAVAALGIYAGFRSGPSLDDAWTMWLPKGIALDHLGLAPQVFTANSTYLPFAHLDYPLLWSVMLGVETHLAGHIDTRAIDAQAAVCVAAFVCSAARLLHGYVRPIVLWPALLFGLLCPALYTQVEGGGADIPLAVYLALYGLCGVIWLNTGSWPLLLLGFLFGASALSIKSEGEPVFLILTILLILAGLRTRRRSWIPLTASCLAALATVVPWTIYRDEHHIAPLIRLADALNPSYLSHRTGRIAPTVNELASNAFGTHQWLIVLPLLLILACIGLAIERRLEWILPILLVVGSLAFWVWAYWSDTLNPADRLVTSGYRVIDSILLPAVLLIPVLTERLLRLDLKAVRSHALVRHA